MLEVQFNSVLFSQIFWPIVPESDDFLSVNSKSQEESWEI